MSLLQCTLPLNKRSADNSLELFLNKRDFTIDANHIEPICGIVLLNNLRNLTDSSEKLYARLECEFRYGSEDSEGVISGVSFTKNFQICSVQIYPKSEDFQSRELEALQELVVKQKKFLPDVILLPFRLSLPDDHPFSVSLQHNLEENPKNKYLGVEYRVQIVHGDDKNCEYQHGSCVQISIRRIPIWTAQLTSTSYTKEVNKKFHLHVGGINVEATLPKEVFYHNESLPMFLVVENNSSNIVTRIKVKVEQVVEFTLFHVKTVHNVILREVTENKMPIHPGHGNWFNSYRLRPTLTDCRNVVGLALDGKLKHEDTTLASSTYIKDKEKRSQMGIIVRYLVRIRLYTGCGGRDVDLEVPFKLSHLRPGDGNVPQTNATQVNRDIFYLGEMLSASMKSRQGSIMPSPFS